MAFMAVLALAGLLLALALSPTIHPAPTGAAVPAAARPVATVRHIAAVPLRGRFPLGVAVTPDGRRSYVSDNRGLSVVDAVTNAVAPRVDLVGGARGVAASPDGQRMYVTRSDGALAVLDAATGRQLRAIPVGAGSDGVAAGAAGRAWVVNRVAGTLTAVDTGSGRVLRRLPLIQGQRVVASSDGARAYAGGLGVAVTVDAATNRPLGVIPVRGAAGAEPVLALAVSPDGSRVYASHPGAVTVLEGRTGAAVGELRPGPAAWGLAVSPSGRYLFSTIRGPDLVTVTDVVNGLVVDRVALPAPPGALVVTSDGRRGFVLSEADQSLQVVDLSRYR
jgi:DNA-binding beta-propeller fold protein YncE